MSGWGGPVRLELRMRLLHTSDWHLGHTLRDFSRAHEHAAFLGWLVETICARQVDVLLVAGDVFDSANPPAAAQELWFDFLARLRRESPQTRVIAIGGNHDSAARLDAPSPVLRALDVTIVGGLPRLRSELQLERIVVDVRSKSGERAWIAAVPFLRLSDLAAEHALEAPERGVRAVYDEVFDAIRARMGAGEALLAMGHLYMVEGRISELSERKILGGNQHAIPVELFPADVTYAALGHLHLAQGVGGRDHVRYSGSPLALSIDEAHYEHQVVLLDLERGRLAALEVLRVPREVEVVRIPARGALPLPDALAELRALAPAEALAPARWPFVEVAIELARPEPSLQAQVADALFGRAARLVKITRVLAAGEPKLRPSAVRALADFTPEQVFRERWSKEYPGDPPNELLGAFHEMVETAAQETR